MITPDVQARIDALEARVAELEALLSEHGVEDAPVEEVRPRSGVVVSVQGGDTFFRAVGVSGICPVCTARWAGEHECRRA